MNYAGKGVTSNKPFSLSSLSFFKPPSMTGKQRAFHFPSSLSFFYLWGAPKRGREQLSFSSPQPSFSTMKGPLPSSHPANRGSFIFRENKGRPPFLSLPFVYAAERATFPLKRTPPETEEKRRGILSLSLSLSSTSTSRRPFVAWKKREQNAIGGQVSNNVYWSHKSRQFVRYFPTAGQRVQQMHFTDFFKKREQGCPPMQNG